MGRRLWPRLFRHPLRGFVLGGAVNPGLRSCLACPGLRSDAPLGHGVGVVASGLEFDVPLGHGVGEIAHEPARAGSRGTICFQDSMA